MRNNRVFRVASDEVAIAKFWQSIIKSDYCWEWQGPKGKSGYGRLSYEKRYVLAHRLSYLLANGELPIDLDVCHECDNPSCVNPSHLWIGTQADNMADKVIKGRAKRPSLIKTHCLNNHELSEANCMVKKDGTRRCYICHKERTNRNRRKAAEKLKA